MFFYPLDNNAYKKANKYDIELYICFICQSVLNTVNI